MYRYVFGTEYYGIYFDIIEENPSRAKEKANKYFPQFKEKTIIEICQTTLDGDDYLIGLIRKNR